MRFLVSVTDFNEAKIAVKGNADIIDIKNPQEGSLGANFPHVISNISREYRPDFLISAAAGDMPNLPGTAALAAKGLAHCGVDFIKVGLLGPNHEEEAIYLLNQVTKAVSDVDDQCKVIAVGYADYNKADTLSVEKLLEAAIKAEIDGVMLDTYLKDGMSILEIRSKEELESFISKAEEHKLITALAGSLQIGDLEEIFDLAPDIVGFRSAVCSNFDRESAIDQQLVTELASKIEEFNSQ